MWPSTLREGSKSPGRRSNPLESGVFKCQDGTMVLVGPTVRTVTVGERHLYELDQWLVEHAGWEIEWGACEHWSVDGCTWC